MLRHGVVITLFFLTEINRVERFGQTKIENAWVVLFVDYDIVRFDIPVDDVEFMGGGQTGGDLFRNTNDVGKIKLTLFEIL